MQIRRIVALFLTACLLGNDLPARAAAIPLAATPSDLTTAQALISRPLWFAHLAGTAPLTRRRTYQRFPNLAPRTVDRWISPWYELPPLLKIAFYQAIGRLSKADDLKVAFLDEHDGHEDRARLFQRIEGLERIIQESADGLRGGFFFGMFPAFAIAVKAGLTGPNGTAAQTALIWLILLASMTVWALIFGGLASVTEHAAYNRAHPGAPLTSGAALDRSAGGRNPQTLEELYSVSLARRPLLHLKIKNRAVLTAESDPQSPGFKASVEMIRKLLPRLEISEAQLVHALLVIDQTRRRIAFLDPIEPGTETPDYLDNDFTIQFHPDRRVIEVMLDSPEFVEMLQEPHGEDILRGAVAHDAGHIADFNRWIGPEDARQLPNPIQISLPPFNREGGIQEIAADVLTRELLGPRGYQNYLEFITSRSFQLDFDQIEKLDAAQRLDMLNRFAYFLVLVESLPKRTTAYSIRNQLNELAQEVIERGIVSDLQWQTLRRHYQWFQDHYRLKPGLIREEKSSRLREFFDDGPGTGQSVPEFMILLGSAAVALLIIPAALKWLVFAAALKAFASLTTRRPPAVLRRFAQAA